MAHHSTTLFPACAGMNRPCGVWVRLEVAVPRVRGDEPDEVEAYTRAIDARLMTREQAEWQLFGTDFNQTFDQKADEIKRLAAADMLPAAAPGAAAPQQTGAQPPKEPQP